MRSSADCTFKQDGQKLVADCGNGPTISGSVDGGHITLLVKTGPKNEYTATFTGELDQRETTITGTWQLTADRGRQEGRFTALKRERVAQVPNAAIAGRVMTADGRPQPDLVVVALRRMPAPDGRQMTTTARAIRNGPNGEFRIANLPPGEYVLYAHPLKPDLAKARLADGRLAVAPMFLNGTQDIRAAQPIALSTGDALSGVEFVIGPGPSRSVSGVVLDESGRPLVHALVQLLPGVEDKIDPSGSLNAYSAADGTFAIDGGIVPGRYRLMAHKPDAPPTDAIGVGPDGSPLAMPGGPAATLTVDVQTTSVSGLRIAFSGRP